MEILFAAALIFLARVADVSMATVRMLLLVKGRRGIAAFVGFFEVSLYLLSLQYVLKAGLSSPLNFIAYAGGYATGNFMGSLLEEKLLSGHVLVEIIAHDVAGGACMANTLREAGFGTTVITGEGRNGPRLVLKVVCDRNDRHRVLAATKGCSAFVFVSDLKGVQGGHFQRKAK
ncbi:hypothetical protein KAR29_00080 [Aminithiophilus ramosus]|uniref:DUF5698 domain-containing protein n=2 Tax=Synergistales TaxID=649776 RepID=A0A9Q7AFR6_9BACT|nr:DUF5698 domain-containing protein [Aminithiophilus ramosus]QTX32389.1 hypothetical protein KAR29_00080 [Aminithiophilus ramosus]QVL36266.1 hypothetical protein KIH16_00080 [Synergistota bacterium]